MNLAQNISLLRLSVVQSFSTQIAERIPEPSMLMSDPEQVTAYHDAAHATLDLLYCFAAELTNFALEPGNIQRMLDLGCGTANCTARLANALQVDQVVAIDASEEMLRVARKSLAESVLRDQITLELGDITELKHRTDGPFDLTTCNLTAHHLPSIDDVASLLEQMHELTSPDGIVFLLDLARLKNQSLNERYVATFSEGQSDRHNEDFLNSMKAAYTPAEIASIVPAGTADHRWLHFTAPFLPTLQVVMRIPRSRIPNRECLWHESPVAFVGNAEWRRLRNGFLRNCLKTWSP